MNPTREELARVRSGDVVTAYYECGATMTAPVQFDGARVVFGGALSNFEVLGPDGLFAAGILGLLVCSDDAGRTMYGRRPTQSEIDAANSGGSCVPQGAV